MKDKVFVGHNGRGMWFCDEDGKKISKVFGMTEALNDLLAFRNEPTYLDYLRKKWGPWFGEEELERSLAEMCGIVLP